MKFFVLILSVAAVVHGGPISQGESMLRLFIESFVKCVNSDTNMCIKEHGLKLVDGMRSARSVRIWDGVNLINNSPKEGKSMDILSESPDVRNQQLTERLWARAAEVVENTELEVSYADDEADESRAIDEVEEGRGKKKKAIKKKLKILIPLLILAKVKAVILVILALVVIAASLFKIAILAKIAFIIKIIALIKALLAKKHAQEEHGWESAHSSWEPHVEHGGHVEHGHGWEGGWSRSRNDANNLAYSAYTN